MCYLHDVHEVSTYRAGPVCLSMRMIHLKDCWTDLGEISYGFYAIVVYSKIVHFDFLHSITPAHQ
jgi:hypothetical protein